MIKDRISDILWSRQEQKLRAAIYALGNTGDKDSWINIQWFLSESSENVRVATVGTLASSSDENAFDLICKQLEADESARAKMVAIEAMKTRPSQGSGGC